MLGALLLVGQYSSGIVLPLIWGSERAKLVGWAIPSSPGVPLRITGDGVPSGVGIPSSVDVAPMAEVSSSMPSAVFPAHVACAVSVVRCQDRL